MNQWLTILALVVFPACKFINQVDRFIEARLGQAPVAYTGPAPVSQCCLCQTKSGFESPLENILLPSYSGDNCTTKMASGHYKNCEKVTLTEGQCNLVKVKRTRDGFKCTPVTRHYVKNGETVAITPPSAKSGPCDDMVRAAVRSLL